MTPIETILSRLIAAPTTEDNPAARQATLAYIASFLEQRGLHVRQYRFGEHGALVATTRRHRKRPAVMLAGHIDVVPGGSHLFTVQRDKDILIGRGALDMKSGIAGYMQLADNLQGRLDAYDFGIMITDDEELGLSNDGTAQLLHLGYHPTSAVLLDGGNNWNIETLAKGSWRFDLVASGKAAHSSRPWEGESASRTLIHALHDLHVRFQHHGPDTNTLNVGVLQGGTARNQIPAEMTAYVEIRSVSEASFAAEQAFMAELCERYGLQLIPHMVKLPVTNDPDNPYLQAFRRSVRAVTGAPAAFCMSYGGSDGEYFCLAGIPCAITYLPGGGHHSEHEWVSRKDLLLLPAVLEDYLGQVAV